MDKTTVIYLLAALIGALISYLGFRFIKDQRNKEEVATLATIGAQLERISIDVREIKHDIKAQERVNSELFQRLVKVEESAKQAHKRINELKIKGDV